MTLTPGQKIGPYEIIELAGSGGMGEVFKAKDTRLDRTVAIKILSAQIASNPDLKQRFEREAKAISSLNHPNICTLYDVGHEEGIDFLVMEYLEGESLSERAKKGPLPLNELFEYAIQIADALDKAHRQGLIHRDLKPANVMLTKSGAKLLDFGLAKISISGGVVEGVSGLTMTTPLTGTGTILGTLQYMSPEQLEGKEADERSDIFSFGALLYEMATGKKAFEGQSQASLIAGILEREPLSISAVAPMTPPALDRLVRKCLSKKADSRWQSASDLADELRWIAQAGSQSGIPSPLSSRRRFRMRAGWVVATLSLVATLVLAGMLFLQKKPEQQVSRFKIGVQEELSNINWPRISPDGKMIAFQATDSTGKRQIYIRSLNSLSAYPLQGTENAGRPFWSPDSKYLAFFTGNQLKKIPASGGPTQLLCEANGFDGSWGTSGIILFDNNTTDSIRQVSSAGGVPTAATTMDRKNGETYHAWPWFLPDGDHFLYLARADTNSSAAGDWILKVGSLDGDVNKELIRVDTRIEYSPTGHILYSRQGTLLAQKFDTDKLELTSEPIPITQNIATTGLNRAIFAVSNNGKLVFLRGALAGNSELVWLDREGNELGKVGEPDSYRDIDLSPDETRLVYGLLDAQSGQEDIWVRDLKRNVSSRLTFDPSGDFTAIWSPDGSKIIYGNDASGSPKIFERLANGLGEPREVFGSASGLSFPTSFSADGKTLYFTRIINNLDIWKMNPDDSATAEAVISNSHREWFSNPSPNGKYLAYMSDESGNLEVYVRALGDGGGKWQISTDGGVQPKWQSDGQELYYMAIPSWNMMTVPINTKGESLEIGIPKKLFNHQYVTGLNQWRYDVTKDGTKFLFNAPLTDGEEAEMILVINWDKELEDR